MTMTDVEFDILWQAVDDYTGLWELVWWVRSHSSLETDEEIVAVVAPAVDRLVAQGMLALFRARWPADDHEPLEAEPGEWQETVTWQPADSDGYGYWVLATRAGLAAYQHEAQQRAEAGYPSPVDRRTPC